MLGPRELGGPHLDGLCHDVLGNCCFLSTYSGLEIFLTSA